MKLITKYLYPLARVSGGLLLHPYQTMQSLVEDRQLVWLAVMPTIILAALTGFWRGVMVPVVRLFTSCSEVASWICLALVWLADWVVSFMVVWQVLLLYLLFRFRWVWRQWRRERGL